MILELNNKVALVTGASRGIGAGIAHALAQEQAAVIGVARSASPEASATCDYRTADVKNESDIQGLAKYVEERYGRLDILVNCAGINFREPIWAASTAHYDEVIDTNLRATFLTTREMVPLMKQGGVIINVTSVLAHLGHPGLAAYASSKGGIAQLTKVAATELGRYGIRVNAITPGYILTPLTESMFRDSEFRDRVVSHTAMGRLGTVDDVARAVLFLASPLAEFVTGHILVVDGGYLAGDPSLVPPTMRQTPPIGQLPWSKKSQ